MPDFPEDLTFFTVTRTVHTSGMLNADVKFEAQVNNGVAVLADLSSELVEVLLTPVYGRLADGVLLDRTGAEGVSLLSAAQVPGGFKWLTTFVDARVNGIPRALGPLIFEAQPNDSPFDLKDADVYAGRREYRGAPASLSGFGFDEDGAISLQNSDGTVVGPVPIPPDVVVVVANDDGTLSFGIA